MISLFTVILVVPTLIVVPFIQSNGELKASVNEGGEEPVVLDASSSPFSVSVFRTQTSEVEKVPLELYVTRVVASEMPADFELEALKAQALAARTYIVKFLQQGTEDTVPEGADVTDTVQYQVYKNETDLRKAWGEDYSWKMNKIKKAVVQTAGKIITYDGQPITPAFFSTSNGYTENSENYWSNKLPYLRSVASPWDKQSPKFEDQKTLPISKVEELLGVSIDPAAEAVAEIKRTESKRVDQITIGGKTFSGRDVREKLDLRSSDFTIKQKNNHLIFTTQGFGHGVGMSQYGANGMAKEGKNYKDIVKYYYNGIKIDEVTTAAPKLAAAN
ncbi:stage II sporulation protein D [Aquibacillus sp. 3ASR75-11]|uniref:Stage II sporulation protein D n=1 Tax=Terrihalobacillus insolitus TaxID=2950438 RepID=A0A9X4AM39_9BACI|nr:stage II sporulation protein D [Terrihalobacillus insolitus]MDC3411804.1 stage II sporulation protein D [Terrihalobacillus insolitus]MDC3425017.1 stage II sporulation protein D [Terrihalobacillus insolitus]